MKLQGLSRAKALARAVLAGRISNGIASERGAGEAESYKRWVMDMAEKVANAAKEGTFLAWVVSVSVTPKKWCSLIWRQHYKSPLPQTLPQRRAVLKGSQGHALPC
jgi:hypothetical protein